MNILHEAGPPVNPQPPPKLTYGSLFSGVGGFDLGFDRAGFSCAWQVEKDDKARAVLTKHWPDVPKYEDVRNVGKQNLATVDVIVGGFPCQDVSLAYDGKGLAGERSGLWFEFYRIIEELKPRWVVIENVPGLLSSNGGRDFAVILRGLAGCGYYAAWRILDAQYFDIPQQRKRVFIVASLGVGDCAGILFEEEPNFSDPRKRDTAPTPVYAYKKRGGYGWSESKEIALTLESQSGTRTGGNDTVPLVFTDNMPRWVIPLEAERIQGFPDYHTDCNSGRTATYRQLGNAVVPQIAEWIARRIATVDGDE